MSRRGKWDQHALKVVALRVDESINFPEIEHDHKSMNCFRVALIQHPITKTVPLSIRWAPVGVRVTRKEDIRQKRDYRLRYRPLVVAPVEAPPVIEAPVTRCLEKACPFPAGLSGRCRQHEFWARQDVSIIGSSLGPGSLAGA